MITRAGSWLNLDQTLDGSGDGLLGDAPIDHCGLVVVLAVVAHNSVRLLSVAIPAARCRDHCKH